ncbi:MAG: hypothetical protein ACOC3J_02650, partial [Gemmatimonadota bacterium]
LVLKHRPAGARPRIAWTIPRAALDGVLRRATAEGWLEAGHAAAYLRAVHSVPRSGDTVFVSLDPPGTTGPLALDLTRVRAGDLPFDDSRFPRDYSFRYVKLRIPAADRPAQWNGYMPLSEAPASPEVTRARADVGARD